MNVLIEYFKVGVIVPTYNAGDLWQEWLTAFASQDCKIHQKLIIDSSSTDDTVSLAKKQGFEVHQIAVNEFDHGGTRQLATELMNDVDIYIFLTQDAILVHTDSLSRMVNVFSYDRVGASYGQQLPRKDASLIEAHARKFNYPDHNQMKSMAQIQILGLKTVFLSDSFSAYRKVALHEVGGFADHLICCEDMYVAANLIKKDWQIYYCADAKVIHSHDYTMLQEFKRYFDIGVFHHQQPWIRQQFGQSEGEGLKFIVSEFEFLRKNKAFMAIVASVVRNLMKYLGYKLGMNEDLINTKLKMKMSMHWRYWQKNK